MKQYTNKVTLDNPGFFRNMEFLTCSNSMDSLDPDTPVFPVLRQAQRAPWVKYHNIVGILTQEQFGNRISGRGDSIVSETSARSDDSMSEVVVDADHQSVQRHPLATLEVRRILLEHWQDSLPAIADQLPPPRVQMARLSDEGAR